MQKFAIGETAVVAEVSDDSPVAFYKNPAYGYQFSYEKAKFSLVQASIFPPESKTAVAGVKLIGADRAASLGKSGCTYGESGKQTTCNADMEDGLFFGVMKADFETALSVANPSLLRAVVLCWCRRQWR